MEFESKSYGAYTIFIEQYTGKKIGKRLSIELPYETNSHFPALQHICYTWLGILDYRFALNPALVDGFYHKQLYKMVPHINKHTNLYLYSICLEQLYTDMVIYSLNIRDEASDYTDHY